MIKYKPNDAKKENAMSLCNLCPRKCNIDRSQGLGFCGESDSLSVARIAPHFYEEPPISGKNGSGTVFFTGCNLRCEFCQNKKISRGELTGKKYSQEELEEAILKLQESGVHNINLVTPTHFADKIIPLLEKLKASGALKVPVVYNTSGYESLETLKALDGLVDIYMPDLKYFSSELSQKYSRAPDYFSVASSAIKEMHRQRGKYRYSSSDGELLENGVLIRHLVLPSHRRDSIEALSHLAELLPPSEVLLSVMSQYTPEFALDSKYKELHRRITSFEYNTVCDKAIELGFEGFTQKRSSASEIYTPSFCEENNNI